MNIYHNSDQSRAFSLYNNTSAVKRRLATLTQEMSSGRVSDVPKEYKGNTQRIRYHEDRLNALSQFRIAASEASFFAEATQNSLSAIQKEAAEIGVSLYAQTTANSSNMTDFMSKRAVKAFEASVEKLNTEVAGVYLFSGTNTDMPALKSADDIITELMVVIGGITTASGIKGAVEAWFDSPAGSGGFIDFAYNGTMDSRIAKVSEDEVTDFTLNAVSAPLRNVLKGYAMAAVVDHGALSGQAHEIRQLMHDAGETIFKNQASLITEQGRMGLLQKRVDRVLTENSSERSVLEMSLGEMVNVDKYDTATALTEAQTQLETIYTLTARLSNLKLVNYLK